MRIKYRESILIRFRVQPSNLASIYRVHPAWILNLFSELANFYTSFDTVLVASFYITECNSRLITFNDVSSSESVGAEPGLRIKLIIYYLHNVIIVITENIIFRRSGWSQFSIQPHVGISFWLNLYKNSTFFNACSSWKSIIC